MKKVKQLPIRINLSFTQEEFECISQHANELDLSLSGFIYANIKMSSAISKFLGHHEIQRAYIKFCESVYDTLEKSKQDSDDIYFEAIQQFQENTKGIDDTMYMAKKLRSFSIEWSKLRLLK